MHTEFRRVQEVLIAGGVRDVLLRCVRKEQKKDNLLSWLLDCVRDVQLCRVQEVSLIVMSEMYYFVMSKQYD